VASSTVPKVVEAKALKNVPTKGTIAGSTNTVTASAAPANQLIKRPKKPPPLLWCGGNFAYNLYKKFKLLKNMI
jgi:hypothetical protein